MWKQNLPSPLGTLTAVWSEIGLSELSFGMTEVGPKERLQHAPKRIQILSEKLVASIQGYFQTGVLDWQLEDLDWTATPPFQRQVLELCFAIPSGHTRTYGQLAYQSGSPKAARAVGGAMARNRWPLIIPCHRVVGGTGNLTGYSGVGGTKTKQWLLELESPSLFASPQLQST
jgi:methylated-DNA-[protein]-cysteine S-methyltransferase